MPSTHEDVARFTLEDHVRAFMEENFHASDFVTIHASTLGQAFDLTGFSCVYQERQNCGYDLFLFENDFMRVAAFCDLMSSKWVVCTHLPLVQEHDD